MSVQLLTHSRQQSFKVCRKQSWFSYELGIRRELDGKPLRMGSAFHDGQEAFAITGDIGAGCEAARNKYKSCPDGWSEAELEYERETVERLLCGYEWRWKDDPVECIATEQQFQLPLINQETGAQSRVWNLAGKIDGVIGLQDGRKAVREFKLLGEDISAESNLWRRLRIDHQISLYVHAARRLGYDVATVMYDVTRKPVIEPTPVPILDDLGCKIVLDMNGERVKTKQGWRVTSDKEKGYTLQVRPMTPTEWGEKLTNDICARPDFYFRRQEIARLDSDLEEYQSELWEIQQTIREAQRSNHWYRTATKNTCDFCSYFNLCTTGNFKPDDQLPEGFIRVYDINPELSNGNSTPACVEQAIAAAPAYEPQF